MFIDDEYVKNLKKLIDIQGEKINLVLDHVKLLEDHYKKTDNFVLGFYAEFSREQVKLNKLDKEIEDLTTELAIRKFKK